MSEVFRHTEPVSKMLRDFQVRIIQEKIAREHRPEGSTDDSEDVGLPDESEDD